MDASVDTGDKRERLSVEELLLNSEALVAVHDEMFSAQVEAMILRDQGPEVARGLDAVEVQRRRRSGSLRSAVAEMFADLM